MELGCFIACGEVRLFILVTMSPGTPEEGQGCSTGLVPCILIRVGVDVHFAHQLPRSR